MPKLIGFRIIWPAGHVHPVVAGVDAFVVHIHQNKPIGWISEIGLLSVDLPHLVSTKRPTGPTSSVNIDTVGADTFRPTLLLGFTEMLVLRAAENVHVFAYEGVKGRNLYPVLRRFVRANVLRCTPRGIYRGLIFQIFSPTVEISRVVPRASIDNVIICVAGEIIPGYQ